MPSDTLFLLSRETTSVGTTPFPGPPGKGSLDLVMAEGSAVDSDWIAAVKPLLRQGGRVCLLTNARDMAWLVGTLEQAGYKQLRYSQICDPTLPGRRLVLLNAVRGGSSTFNDIYNNGTFPRSDSPDPALIPSDPRRHLLSEMVSICTDPGATIGATKDTLKDLSGLPVRHRTKPVKPARTEARKRA